MATAAMAEPAEQPDQLAASIVCILAADGTVVGAGFLASDRHLLTCAHVVAQALGIPDDSTGIPTGQVQLTFPLLSSAEVLTGRVVCWRPVQPDTVHSPAEDEDIAVLALDHGPPGDSRPARLVKAGDLWGHPFRAFGFPTGHDNGTWATGVLRAEVAGGWVQIEDVKETGYFVAPGFSGTPIWDEHAGGVVGMVVGAEKRADIRAAFFIPVTRLIQAWPDLDHQAIPSSPYRGLFAFREQDARFFFGRAQVTEALVEAVRNKPLVAVIGPSGCGKSSVVFAGLVPRLRQEGAWLIVSFRPGNSPFHSLAASLLPVLEPQTSETDRLIEIGKLAEALRKGEVALWDVTQRILQKEPAAGSLLLIADQFEELYTLCREPEERQRLLDVLLAAVQEAPPLHGSRLALVASLRADFLDHALSYRPMADALQQADLKLGPMNRQELQEVVERPAEQLGVMIEEGLTKRMLDAVSEEPGDLPLLEFTLALLWAKQTDGKLSHVAYDQFGGVQKALASYAEEVFGKLSQEEREQAQRVFIQLVRPGEGTADTRRRATRAEIGEENWGLVTRLADARLVVSGRDAATGMETVEIVHEAMIKGCHHLREWLAAARGFRTWQERLRAVLHQWETSGRDEGALLRGAPLAEAEGWLHQRQFVMSPDEKAFVEGSIALRAREQRARQHRIQFVWLGVVAAAVTLGALLWRERAAGEHLKTMQQIAEAKSQLAEDKSELALAWRLTTQAQSPENQQGSRLALGALLAIESLKRFPSSEASQVLQEALDLLPRPVPPFTHGDAVSGAVFSPDGKYLATASSDKTARVWEIATGRQVSRMKHEGAVRAIAFSPDGRCVATASVDHTACVWEAGTGHQLHRLPHEGELWWIAYSPDGRYLATASADHTARVWEAATGRLVGKKLPHGGSVYQVAFSPDGRFLATASHDHFARVWEWATGHMVARMRHKDIVNAIAFSPDGRLLASASEDKTARVWAVAHGREIAPPIRHDDIVWDVAFSRDGKYLATASGDRIAVVWEVGSRREIHRLKHEDIVNAVAFSRDSKYLATASSDYTARIWEITSGREVARMAHDGGVVAVAFSPDGHQLATASKDKTARVWETTTRSKVLWMQHGSTVFSVAYSPQDGRYLATASYDHRACVWDTATGHRVGKPFRHPSAVLFVAFSPDGKYLATAGEDHIARVWDVASGHLLRRMPHGDVILSIAFSPNGKYLATASVDHTAQVWEVSTGRHVRTLPHQRPVRAIAYSPDGNYLATGSDDKVARVWRASDYHLIRELNHGGEVTAVAYSPQGNYLATASYDGTARVWDPASGREVTTLTVGVPIFSIAFSPNGTFLATGSRDGTARVWETTSGHEIGRIRHKDSVNAVSFSPDGHHLATGDQDGTVQVRTWRSAEKEKANKLIAEKEKAKKLIEEAHKYLPRNLTREESRQYLGR